MVEACRTTTDCDAVHPPPHSSCLNVIMNDEEYQMMLLWGHSARIPIRTGNLRSFAGVVGVRSSMVYAEIAMRNEPILQMQLTMSPAKVAPSASTTPPRDSAGPIAPRPA